MKLKLLAITLTSLILPTTSFSEEGKFSIGLAGISSTSIYKHKGDTSIVAPSIEYKGKNFSLDVTNGFKYKIDDTTSVYIKPKMHALSKTSLSEYENFNRENTLAIGLSTKYDVVKGTSINLSAETEILEKYSGSEIDISVSQFIPPILLPLPMIVSAGTTIKDSKTANYYYGVNKSDLNNTFQSNYTLDTIHNPYLGISAFYKVSENINLFTNIKITKYDDKILNSPIIRDGEFQTSIVTAVSYQF